MRLFYDDKIEKFRKATDEEPSHIYIDDFLYQKILNIQFLQRKNWDCCGIICGSEGSGKSTLSFTMAQILAENKLTLNNIANGSDDAMEKLRTLPDGSILVLDEAELLFASRDTMTKEQRQMTKIFMIIRQKRMVLLLVTPSFFDLSKYVAVDRSRFLIRVYTDSQLTRGKFAYWGTKRKARLYHEGKKNYGQYIKPRAQCVGRFIDYKLPFDKEYQETKLATLLKAFEKKEVRKKKSKDELEPGISPIPKSI